MTHHPIHISAPVKDMNRAELAVTFIPCSTCKALPKEGCSTKSGNRYLGLWYVHQSRLDPFYFEWKRGYQQGKKATEAQIASTKKEVSDGTT